MKNNITCSFTPFIFIFYSSSPLQHQKQLSSPSNVKNTMVVVLIVIASYHTNHTYRHTIKANKIITVDHIRSIFFKMKQNTLQIVSLKHKKIISRVVSRHFHYILISRLPPTSKMIIVSL